MDLTPPLAPSVPNPIRAGLPEPVDGYLAQLADEQTRFLATWTDANRSLRPSSAQVAKLAAVQLRMTQEFLDAQRAIVRRRAETEAAIVAIAADAASESAALVDAARSRASIVVGTLPPPAIAMDWARMLPPPDTGAPMAPPAAALMPPRPSTQTDRPDSPAAPAVDDESLARLIDGVFEASEPDGTAARRELRTLLDGWWGVENQEAQAAIDDAHARAAMHVHLARIEADELSRFAPPSLPSPEPPPLPTRPSNTLSTPLTSALDETDHEHLDDVLARLLDGLEPTPDDVAAEEDRLATLFEAYEPQLPDPAPPPSDSLNDPSGAPQEQFDRFWGAFAASGSRSWLFPQLLLPAVTVIAVLALVLAVVG